MNERRLAWAMLAAALATGCGHRVSRNEATLLGAIVGVSATELQLTIGPAQLDAIAHDLGTQDPVSQKLGLAECVLLQTRAAALGREAAAILPLLGPRPKQLGPVAAELQGAVRCGGAAPFDAAKLGKLLRSNLVQLQAMLPQAAASRRRSGS